MSLEMSQSSIAQKTSHQLRNMPVIFFKGFGIFNYYCCQFEEKRTASQQRSFEARPLTRFWRNEEMERLKLGATHINNSMPRLIRDICISCQALVWRHFGNTKGHVTCSVYQQVRYAVFSPRRAVIIAKRRKKLQSR